MKGRRNPPSSPPPRGPKRPAGPLRYLLFHKPYGVLCQFTAEGGRPCLKDYVPVEDVYACGRLDFDSEGLLLLTNDGPLIQGLSAPEAKAPKTYYAQVEGTVSEAALDKLRTGIPLDGKTTLPAQADICPVPPAFPPRPVPIRTRLRIPTTWLRLVLVEGRNRQVRRMTAAAGNPTLRLIRQAIGPFGLEGLEPGQWRELARDEVRRALGNGYFSPG